MINLPSLRQLCHEIYGNSNKSEYLSAEAYYNDLVVFINRSQPREFTSIAELISAYELSSYEV